MRTRAWERLLRLDFGKFDWVGGVGYALSLLVVWALMAPFGTGAYIAGVATLLVWLSDTPGVMWRGRGRARLGDLLPDHAGGEGPVVAYIVLRPTPPGGAAQRIDPNLESLE